eukprot:2967967-Prymnesium_polylepis.1
MLTLVVQRPHIVRKRFDGLESTCRRRRAGSRFCDKERLARGAGAGTASEARMKSRPSEWHVGLAP